MEHAHIIIIIIIKTCYRYYYQYYTFLHNEELNDLYCSTNIVWVIKSRRIRWAGHVARMGEGRAVDRVVVGKPEGKEIAGETQV